MRDVTKAFVLNIGHDETGHFVYAIPGCVEYRGTYTQCLIVVGGVALGNTLHASMLLANDIKAL